MDVRVLDSAACVGVDPVVFFPVSTSDSAYEDARKVCAGCPIVRECLAAAMRSETLANGKPLVYRFGMFGGLTPRERVELAEGGGS